MNKVGLERWWWQLFWQLRRQCMPVEVMAGVMADIAVTVVGMLSNMPRPAMLRADTLVSVLAVDVVTMLRGPRADTGAMQLAHITGAMQLAPIIGMAAVTGEGVTGEAITGIRPMDILGGLLQLGLWLSILRDWLLRLPLRWVLSVLRKLGILPLPLRILAVRELQLRVLD